MTSPLIFSAMPPSQNLDLPKLLNAPQVKVESVLGKAFKPKKDPGYFFTPKGYDVIRINGFGGDMNAISIKFNDLLTPPQVLSKLGLGADKPELKALPNPTNVAVQLVRERYQIRLKGLQVNSKTHKPWIVDYEQDAIGNALRAKALKDKIQNASGPDRIRLIQSCYDWRTTVVVDSR